MVILGIDISERTDIANIRLTGCYVPDYIVVRFTANPFKSDTKILFQLLEKWCIGLLITEVGAMRNNGNRQCFDLRLCGMDGCM